MLLSYRMYCVYETVHWDNFNMLNFTVFIVFQIMGSAVYGVIFSLLFHDIALLLE